MDKQKYEREIEEILARYDKEKDSDRKKRPDNATRPIGNYAPPPPVPRSQPRRQQSFLPSSWRRISAGQYIGLAFLVAFLAAFARPFPTLATLLVIVSVALFFIPIILYWQTGTTSGGWTSNEQKRWRGQVIDFNTRRDITNDPLSGIKRWFKRKK
jgi:hypothetical protein